LVGVTVGVSVGVAVGVGEIRQGPVQNPVGLESACRQRPVERQLVTLAHPVPSGVSQHASIVPSKSAQSDGQDPHEGKEFSTQASVSAF